MMHIFDAIRRAKDEALFSLLVRGGFFSPTFPRKN
jgi:hypothetical protein